MHFVIVVTVGLWHASNTDTIRLINSIWIDDIVGNCCGWKTCMDFEAAKMLLKKKAKKVCIIETTNLKLYTCTTNTYVHYTSKLSTITIGL